MQSESRQAGGEGLRHGLHGVNPSLVVDALKQRVLLRRKGEAGSDGRKLALVLEGGAMRAAATAGGALALAHLGLTEVFDEVYATSAGAINASYLLSGQGDLGITIYFEDLTTGRFINRLRFWKMVDVDYVFREIISLKKPLDVRRVLDSRTQFYATVLDKETGQASLIDTKSTKTPLLNVLKASLAMPVLYNRTVEVEGKRCMDGGLQIPFPLQQAIDNGCTDIFLLLSRPKEYVSKLPHWWNCLFFDLACAHGRRGINRTYALHHVYTRAARDLALGRSSRVPANVNLAAVCLEQTEPIHWRTVDPVALRAAALSYGLRTLRVLGVDGKKWNLGPASVLEWDNGSE